MTTLTQAEASALDMGFHSPELNRRTEKQPIFFGTLVSVADGSFAPAVGGVLTSTAPTTMSPTSTRPARSRR